MNDHSLLPRSLGITRAKRIVFKGTRVERGEKLKDLKHLRLRVEKVESSKTRFESQGQEGHSHHLKVRKDQVVNLVMHESKYNTMSHHGLSDEIAQGNNPLDHANPRPLNTVYLTPIFPPGRVLDDTKRPDTWDNFIIFPYGANATTYNEYNPTILARSGPLNPSFLTETPPATLRKPRVVKYDESMNFKDHVTTFVVEI